MDEKDEWLRSLTDDKGLTKSGAAVKINGRYRWVNLKVIRDRWKMGGNQMIHNPTINVTFKIVEK